MISAALQTVKGHFAQQGMPVAPGFAERLGAFMKAKNLSQSALARQSGVSRVTIGAWLTGSATPENEDKVRDVARVLGKSWRELWGDSTPPGAAERTRLAQLESFWQRVSALVEEFEPSIGAGEPPHARPEVTTPGPRPGRRASGDER